jgi:hypothetical protein
MGRGRGRGSEETLTGWNDAWQRRRSAFLCSWGLVEGLPPSGGTNPAEMAARYGAATTLLDWSTRSTFVLSRDRDYLFIQPRRS